MAVVSSYDPQVEDRAVGERTAQTKRRVILLGASNLTRAISTVIGIAQATLDGPLDIVAALGHGRSYGMWSRVLFRELPGINGGPGSKRSRWSPTLGTTSFMAQVLMKS